MGIPWNDHHTTGFPDTDVQPGSKLVFLILWIVSLIGLAVYLIVVEYLHDKMQRQLAMTGMTTEDLIHEIKEERGE